MVSDTTWLSVFWYGKIKRTHQNEIW